MDVALLTYLLTIPGNKKENVTIIYTPWTNLHKNAAMATGQVGFHDNKMVNNFFSSDPPLAHSGRRAECYTLSCLISVL